MFPPTLLSYYSRFLSALQQNRAQVRLLCVMKKIPLSPHALPSNVQDKLLADGVTALAPAFILS